MKLRSEYAQPGNRGINLAMRFTTTINQSFKRCNATQFNKKKTLESNNTLQREFF